MKTSGSILFASLFLIQFMGTPLFGQGNDPAGGKKITITKHTTEADGSETVETIIKKGKAADAFDVDQYLKTNKADNVQLDVHVEDGDSEQNIRSGRGQTSAPNLRFLHLLGGAFLGVEEDMQEKANEPGLTVKVVKGSPAAKSGIKTNDVILQLNDTQVNTWNEMTNFMHKVQPGDQIKITYIHKGITNTTQATLTSKGEFQAWQTTSRKGFLGVNLDARDNEDKGVAVTIVKKSAAEKAGLENGDLIIRLNDNDIKAWEDITAVMSETRPGDTLTIYYERNGQEYSTKATLGEEKSWDWSSWNDLGENLNNLSISVRDKEACLGVYSESSGSGEQSGARVSDFMDESAAKEASLEKGDIITSLDGNRIQGYDDLWNEVAKHKPGENVTIEYLHNGIRHTTKVALKTCRNKDNQVIINDTNEAGDNQTRKFFLSNWGHEEEKSIRERRVIAIHKGEGDAAQTNPAPANDRSLALYSFQVSPNPTQGQVTIEFRAEPVATTVSLFDLSGRQLFREELNAFNGDYRQQFDLTEHAKSTILIQIQQNQKMYTEQIRVN